MTSLNVYGTTTASSTLSTSAQLANSLSGSGGSVGTQIGNSTGWGELYGLGTASAWPASGSQGSPSGNGFLWDVTTLEGKQIIAGNWTPSFILWLSQNNTITADIWCRAYKRSSGGTYTLIGSMSLTSQTLNTTHTTYTFSASSLSLMNFTTGDKLYIDLWLHVTANTGGLGSTNVTVGVGSASGGVANRVEVDTPGYQTTPTTKSTSIRTLVRTQVTKSAGMRTLVRTQKTISAVLRTLVRTQRTLSIGIRTLVNGITKNTSIRVRIRTNTTRSTALRVKLVGLIAVSTALRTVIRTQKSVSVGIRIPTVTLVAQVVQVTTQARDGKNITTQARDGKNITIYSRSNG